MRYVNVEYAAAASLALGWLVGGALSGACSDEWQGLEEEARRRRLLTGWLAGAPLACACKYGTLAQQQLPSLGRSAQARPKPNSNTNANPNPNPSPSPSPKP